MTRTSSPPIALRAGARIRWWGAIAAAACVAGVLTALPGGAAQAAGDQSLGTATDVQQDGDAYTFTAGDARLRVTFESADAVRVELAPTGTFTDPANDKPSNPADPAAKIVVGDLGGHAGSALSTTADGWSIATAKATLTVAKSPLTMSLKDSSGKTLWAETSPLSWNANGMTQHLTRGATEQFFGGGMQNGRFSHRDQTISISRDYNWNDGGNPNAAPFYLSSNGYGVLRDTFASGSYSFGDPVATTHGEQRFDAYYFVGDTRGVLDDYTKLTGRPAMLPMYSMEIGDADCYLHNANRGERHTLPGATAIADGYQQNGMPLGWMLVNDGYGCGYEQLPQVHDMLTSHDSELGLWTQSDLTNQQYEVQSGVRVRKTDVAWVGPGYRFALSACEKAQKGIEDNTTDRSTVLTIEGWAGTQRCGAVWSGDQSGSWDYIRWQIPTYAGTTMSGQPNSTGDIDGIFGGSADTYTRDLQWKMFLPTTYAMSGWASSDKQPYRYGEPYTTINRDYLMLHERLLPYLYTYQAQAHATGLGSTRPLYVDYPNDPNTWGDAVKYEFMAGDSFLVAPVYSDTTVRNGIYLPEGTWVDYWSGRTFTGPTTVDGYAAPLDRLPLFVKAGAVVPMFPQGTTDWAAGKKAGRLDVDLYPKGTSSFSLYEDDGRSQAGENGKNATQKIAVTAPAEGSGQIHVSVGALKGDYAGKPDARSYRLSVHTDTRPSTVRLAGAKLTEVSSSADLDKGPGYFYDQAAGVLRIQTDSRSTGAEFAVDITGSTAVGGVHPENRAVDAAVSVDALSMAGGSANATVTATNHTGADLKVTSTALQLPQGWTATATGATTNTLVPDGATFTVPFTVSVPASAAPGAQTVTAQVGYTVRSASWTVGAQAQTTVAYASLNAAFNNNGISTADAPATANIDGGGSSFIADRLAAAGAGRGATVTANGFSFTMPDVAAGNPDNVAGGARTVPVSGQGNALAVLGTGTSGSATDAVTVHYADGSTSAGTLGMPNWCCLATNAYGAKIAVVTKGKNTPTGPAYPTTEYRLYTNTVQIDPDKKVIAVTLPGNASVHVFALTVGTQVIIPPPIADGQYALTVGSGGVLTAPGTNAAQLTVAPAAAGDASQKWVVTRLGGSEYTVKNASSGYCVDVFYSSKSEGAVVGQYTCGGTDNQTWVLSKNADGTLKLANKNSGLSLTADAGGLVVQRTDTGATSQRWTASAN
ncbi:RICIN domain-containing protein [Microbacterium sp. ASV49]|uniref:Glycoside hydrolase family 31 protein n=1 Tax=Microbacterium candidum TaxID=3041922 RepID=A0ABT7MVC0_9MICO|nr:RICIN domain-containing protein [Microbacterium sp. ASV49]MDL9978399.1 glycoside hydrolase family 31 protein [Microbacterium sp. ASV49]